MHVKTKPTTQLLNAIYRMTSLTRYKHNMPATEITIKHHIADTFSNYNYNNSWLNSNHNHSR